MLQAVERNHTDGLNSLAENLKELVGDGRTLVDKDDVIFLSRVIEGLSRSVGSNEKVSKFASAQCHRFRTFIALMLYPMCVVCRIRLVSLHHMSVPLSGVQTIG